MSNHYLFTYTSTGKILIVPFPFIQNSKLLEIIKIELHRFPELDKSVVPVWIQKFLFSILTIIYDIRAIRSKSLKIEFKITYLKNMKKLASKLQKVDRQNYPKGLVQNIKSY